MFVCKENKIYVLHKNGNKYVTFLKKIIKMTCFSSIYKLF